VGQDGAAGSEPHRRDRDRTGGAPAGKKHCPADKRRSEGKVDHTHGDADNDQDRVRKVGVTHEHAERRGEDILQKDHFTVSGCMCREIRAANRPAPRKRVATPRIRLSVDTMPSFAPSPAARSQPMRGRVAELLEIRRRRNLRLT
jgi:hypothetical protein